jgi:cation diffusion facilitator CzcD-associated flavoprotein CzcO
MCGEWIWGPLILIAPPFVFVYALIVACLTGLSDCLHFLRRLCPGRIVHTEAAELDTRSPPLLEPVVAIVGAGFSGLALAKKLKDQGIPFVVFERLDRPGGVWRQNQYPGCACDIPSYLYSFSFFPNPHWSRSHATQPELQRYLERCVDTFGLSPFVRYCHTVNSAEWDEAAHCWRMVVTNTSAAGDCQRELSVACLVSAQGILNVPKHLDVPGKLTFAGRSFHSAEWPLGFMPHGQRVAIIGSAASAVQITPALQPIASHITLFQRTPNWVLPRNDLEFPPWWQWCLKNLPVVYVSFHGRNSRAHSVRLQQLQVCLCSV